jgi:hypothetical protein
MDKIQKAFSAKERDSELMVSFGFRLHNQFAINEKDRRPKELQWLQDLRATKGIYDPEVQIETNNSQYYPKITRSKINIVLSRLHEMLFPETERNWELMPTPEPSIDERVVNEIAQSLIQPATVDPETGQQIPQQMPTEDEVRLAIHKHAAEKCVKMSSEIADQLEDMKYSDETKKVLRSGLQFGTGIMKGPLIKKKEKKTWQTASGIYSEKAEKKETPYFGAVRIWDWYPDMSVTDIETIEGSFERHLMTKHDLRQLLKRPDFYSDIIKEYMDTHPSGNYTPKNWEVDLQVLEVQARSGDTSKRVLSDSTFTSSSDNVYRSSDRQLGKKYEVLEFWGYVDGADLAACGLDIEDTEIEYAANVWLLGDRPIKATLFEGALNHYKVFYYEKDETSLFGEGLARIMRGSQLAVGASARMALDNGSVTSGPQVEVNYSLLVPDTDLNSFYPRKIWFREGRGIEANYPAIRSLQFESHIPELLNMIQTFESFADKETTLPTWMIGQQVNNETAQATSSRMSTITISIKDVVKNFDDFTEKILKDLYEWNMEFNPREDIKGDYSVKARGVSSLVMKEIRMQAINQFTTTLTDQERDYIPEREFLQEKMRVHDLNIKLLTEEEVRELRQARQESEENRLAIETAIAEIKYKNAQTMAQLAKAKEKNVLANKEAITPPETKETADPRLAEMELLKEQIGIEQQQKKSDLEMGMEIENHELEMKKKKLEMLQSEMKIESDISLKAEGIRNKKQAVKKPAKKEKK